MGCLGDSSQLKVYVLPKFTSSREDPAGQKKQALGYNNWATPREGSWMDMGPHFLLCPKLLLSLEQS